MIDEVEREGFTIVLVAVYVQARRKEPLLAQGISD
jgi:hypothetical protein